MDFLVLVFGHEVARRRQEVWLLCMLRFLFLGSKIISYYEVIIIKNELYLVRTFS